MRLKDTSGFTLVEILLASVASIVVSLAMYSLYLVTIRSSALSVAQGELDVQVSLIHQAILNTDCIGSIFDPANPLLTAEAPSVGEKLVRLGAGELVTGARFQTAAGTLEIVEISLTRPALSTPIATRGLSSEWAILELEVRGRSSLLPTVDLKSSFVFSARINPPGTTANPGPRPKAQACGSSSDLKKIECMTYAGVSGQECSYINKAWINAMAACLAFFGTFCETLSGGNPGYTMGTYPPDDT